MRIRVNELEYKERYNRFSRKVRKDAKSIYKINMLSLNELIDKYNKGLVRN